MKKQCRKVFEPLRSNFTKICTAEIRIQDPVGARMTTLSANTALEYSCYEDCHLVDRFIPANCYGNLGSIHLFFQICETAGYLRNLNFSLMNYLGIIVTLLAGDPLPICFPVCNPTFKTMNFIENGNNI